MTAHTEIQTPKSSAEEAAWIRALSALERDPSIRNPDSLAACFVEKRRWTLAFPRVMRFVLERMAPGGYWYHLARTKHIDEILDSNLAAGLRQLVILGAGFDSRPHRFHDRLRAGHVKTFELDFPSTQALKQKRLSRKISTVLNDHAYVPIDFNTQLLEHCLRQTSYHVNARTLFIWEGVSMFLTPDAVDRTLDFIRAHSARGSELVFDYIVRTAIQGDHSAYGAKQSFKYASRLGEPYRFGLEPPEVRSFLEARGFEMRSDCGGLQLERSHLASTNGERRVWGFIRLVHARTV